MPSLSYADPKREVKKHAGVALQWAARAGYVTKGLIYAIVGVLAAMAAWGAGGETTDTHGAVATIGRQWLGGVLLWAVAIGLWGYCLWRFVEAITDTEHRRTGVRGIVQRGGFVISGIAYGLLGYEAAVHGVRGEGNTERTLAATILSWPGGFVLAAALGLAVAAYGIYQMRQSYSGSFLRQFSGGKLRGRALLAAKYSGRFGLAARGILFAIVGLFVVVAAIKADPGEAKGIGDALDFVAAQPLGPWLLLVVAVGLVAYGAYCFVRARYRSFETRALAT